MPFQPKCGLDRVVGGLGATLGILVLLACGPARRSPPKAAAAPAALIPDKAQPQAVARTPKAGPRAPAVKAPVDLGPLRAAWAQRQAMACTVDLQVTQGTQPQGRVQGRVAWSSVTHAVTAQLKGRRGEQRCEVRLATLKDALLVERWDPKLALATTRRLPRESASLHMAAMRELASPMLRGLLEMGCAELFPLPPQASAWKATGKAPDKVTWTAPQGALQTLTLEPQSKVPKLRTLSFPDPAGGAPLRWTLALSCQASA